MIENLPLLTPDPARAERRRARCHARMAQHRRAEPEAEAPNQSALEPAVVGGLCMIFLSAVAAITAQVFGGR